MARYYGTKCANRDCEMTPWSAWSTCRCGYTDKKNRTRTIQTPSAGEGLQCPAAKEESICAMTPCNCAVEKPGYRGERCESRDCVLHQWGSWTGSNCDGCPSAEKLCVPRNTCPNWSTTWPTRHRSRGAKITKDGYGKDCDTQNESSSCGYKCETYCERLYQKRLMFRCFMKRYNV